MLSFLIIRTRLYDGYCAWSGIILNEAMKMHLWSASSYSSSCSLVIIVRYPQSSLCLDNFKKEIFRTVWITLKGEHVCHNKRTLLVRLVRFGWGRLGLVWLMKSPTPPRWLTSVLKNRWERRKRGGWEGGEGREEVWGEGRGRQVVWDCTFTPNKLLIFS